jgi:hypothetical protein
MSRQRDLFISANEGVVQADVHLGCVFIAAKGESDESIVGCCWNLRNHLAQIQPGYQEKLEVTQAIQVTNPETMLQVIRLLLSRNRLANSAYADVPPGILTQMRKKRAKYLKKYGH